MPTRSIFLILALTLATPIAHAEVPAPASTHLDLEVDPTAYVFDGYSAHVGIGRNHLRLDLGAYAMDLPELLHGNEGWDASFAGFGAKLQWFLRAPQRGLFVDLGVGDSRHDVTLQRTGHQHRSWVPGVGASIGYRFSLPYRFYVTPWAGLDVDLTHTDVMVDGERFEMSRVTPFAAVHLGYRFR